MTCVIPCNCTLARWRAFAVRGHPAATGFQRQTGATRRDGRATVLAGDESLGRTIARICGRAEPGNGLPIQDHVLLHSCTGMNPTERYHCGAHLVKALQHRGRSGWLWHCPLGGDRGLGEKSVIIRSLTKGASKHLVAPSSGWCSCWRWALVCSSCWRRNR